MKRIKNKPTVEYPVGKREKKQRFLNVVLTVFAGLLAGATVLLIALTVALKKEIRPSWEEKNSTVVTSRGVSQLFYYDFDDREARTGTLKPMPGGKLSGGVAIKDVKYEDVPQDLINAFVSIEDKRFWEHHGVDWQRTLAAGLNYCVGYTGKFGASTITQQLIKNVSGENDYSVRRKVQEIFWANDLENRCTKEEILERYFNVINLSQGCFGVGTAAEYYFGKSVRDLSTAECAAIAAITNNPSYYDPVRFPEHTLLRRNLILEEMREQGYLSDKAFDEALREELSLTESCRASKENVHSWYTDLVIEDVLRDLCEVRGLSRQTANRLLWSGGLVIETAVDPEIQSAVEKYYSNTNNFPVHSDGKRAQSGIIVIDPATGDILAVAGGIGKKEGNRVQNRATGTKRPPASAIKPLSVYAPALERGIITWASVYDDVPVEFKTAADGSDKPVPWPKNANRRYRGLTDIRTAVADSTNTVALRVLRDLGTEESFRFLKEELQMESLIENRRTEDGRTISDCAEAALALGQMNYGVTLRELCAAYGMIANGGVFLRPHSYFRVLTREGEVLLSNASEGRAVISEQNACVMTKLLEEVVKSGTGREAKLDLKSVAVAGKTGTSNADCDKWFVGYTPKLLAGVWYGFDYPRPLSDGKVTGNPAVRIWKSVMTELIAAAPEYGENCDEFPLAPGVIRATYCPDSGGLPTVACESDPRGARRAVGYFVQGTEPKSYCDRHLLITPGMSGETISGEWESANEKRRGVGKIRISRSFPIPVHVADEKYALSS